jgi:lipoprotein-releasing system ATP-binding protein
MNNPAVILADEPTGNLDTDNAEALFDLFRELRDREGATFAVVTHNDALAATADRIVRMRDGRIEGGGGGRG